MTAKEALDELEETFEVLVPDQAGCAMRDACRCIKAVRTELGCSQDNLSSARHVRDEALKFIDKLGLGIDFDLYMTGDLENGRLDQIGKAIKEAT